MRHAPTTQRRATPVTALWSWGVATLIVACGGGAVEHPPATSADFAFIAQQEARIAATSGGECGVSAAEETCLAAEALCAVARGTRDADARARCVSAERICEAVERRCRATR